MENKIIFDAQNVDIEDIMTQIHRKIETRGYSLDDLKSLKDFKIKPPASTNGLNPPVTANLDENSQRVIQTASVQYWWVIPGQSGFRNKLKALRYKITRKFTFFYMKYVMDQQNIFNSSAANTISLLTEKNKQLEKQLSEQNKRLTQLEKLVENMKIRG